MATDVKEKPTFSIALWDHDLEAFSERLATKHLGGPAVDLSRAELNLALRNLRREWSDCSILVWSDCSIIVTGDD